MQQLFLFLVVLGVATFQPEAAPISSQGTPIMNTRDANALAAASPNFGFLAPYGERLLRAAIAAERSVLENPVTTLMHLRQFGELLAQDVAARTGTFCERGETQAGLLRRLRQADVLTSDLSALFDGLRSTGNAASHRQVGDRREALHQLRMARKIAIWFHRTLGSNPRFDAGAFVPPPDPAEEDRLLQAELQRLREQLVQVTAAAQSLSATAEEEAALRAEAVRARQQAYDDLNAALALAEETEQQKAEADAQWRIRVAALQSAAEAAPPEAVAAIVDRAQAAGAADQLDLDEAATRKLIDAQLCAAGWEADTEAIAYKQGVRPIKGKNLAIAEWPTSSGPADYVLFVGLTAIAVVEAKRKRKDVAGAISQAKRYSRDFVITGDVQRAGGPWADYQIPFLFATNGRGFHRQFKTASGIWFLDARRSTNHADALDGWYTPEGLLARLSQDHEKAEDALKREPTGYLQLRDYQIDAIHAVEAGIKDGKREILLAMATGTGKTRTALGLIYRLIKAKRFRRVLFLVDRTALGEQAENAFKNVKLENLQSFDQIYDVKSLGDATPDSDTRLHFATVQGMVKRLLYADDSPPMPIDRYDCIIVDESHRGYNLDREMSEGEVQYRSQRDYVSSYRRVIDHFDAVRVGLTATPALHTSEIFGRPVYQYSYRQAVIDGYLVDHEPPIQIKTELNVNGIHWMLGEEVAVYRRSTDQLELFNTPDEIDIEVDGFNTKVVTENFNRVICQQLAQDIDPTLPGKTMIFCATDAHADLVVDLLKKAFTEAYDEVDDDAVMKITGAADKPMQLIRRYKNEALPKVAVTVDLLTTGIDVPEITNLVFIRRVRSRILYDQMVGRATRLCPEIGKEFFRIYDAVDLYSALRDHTEMKPVVTRPSFTFVQLVDELLRIDDDPQHCEAIAADLLVKFHRRRQYLDGESLPDFEAAAGMDPPAFTDLLKDRDPAAIRGHFADHPRLAPFLDSLKPPTGPGTLISEHPDSLLGTERGYGQGKQPADYLDSFKAYLSRASNEIPAMLIVTQRPKDLTRAQLKEISLVLDEHGYSISHLRSAWRDVSNQDIAASIIGFIRQQALGCPLVPYQERVDRALKTTLAKQPWTPPQRKWLERIASQLKQETIVDKTALDRGQFEAQGGFRRLNKIFGGKLETILSDLQEQVWQDAV